MNIRIEPQDYAYISPSERSQIENPIVRAVKRAIRNNGASQNPGRPAGDWVIGKMPVFDEYNLRAGLRMPQLFVISQNDPLTTEFYVLPPAAQVFLQQWFSAAPVHPVKFELPIPEAKAEKANDLYQPNSSMDEGYVNTPNDAFRDIDSLKRGLARFVSESGKDFGLGPVKEGVAKLNAVGQLPVSVIGRELGRLLVTPIGSSAKSRATDDDLQAASAK